MSFEKQLIINNINHTLKYNEDEIINLQNFSTFGKEYENFVARKKDFLKIQIQIQGECQSPITINSQLLHDDNIAILLHKIRPFILQSEPTYLPKIMNLLSREINDTLVRQYIKQQRENFLIKQDKQAIQLHVIDSNININSDNILNLWLNTEEYHRDNKKRKELKVILDGLPSNLFQYFMQEAIINKTTTILKILELVNAILYTNRIEINKK
ncbi:hypothetical protein C9926_00870 [Sulfurovum lithotrophicum]|nr:hypothetical protein C9926_00870 [Sulfurovum lithotrophicum]